MDLDYLNCLVHDYISTVDPKLAKKFKTEAKLTSELPPGSPAIGEVVQYFNETSNSTKKKRKNEFPKEETSSIKKSKKNFVPEDLSLETRTEERAEDMVVERVPPVPVERKRIFIKNVGKDCVYEDFQEKVEKFGEVSDFLNPGRGFCFLTLSSSKAAKECVAALNKTEIAGKVVLMKISREDSESKAEANTIEGCKLFVHGVKQETDEDNIKAAFGEFGKVVDSFNPGKGFAFVTFSTPEEATAAVEALNGKEVCGSTVTVNVSKPKVNDDVLESKAKKMKRVPPVPVERKKIFIKNVGKDCVYEDFQEKVGKFGEVADFLNPGRGFCFLTFSSSKAAKECVTALNKTEIAGKVVLMNIAREESESEAESKTIEGCKLFVHGVKQDTDEEDMKAAFEEFGKVVDAFNPGKGFAFVTFSTPEEASAAAEALDGKEVCGSTVSVNVSKPKVKPEADKNEGVKAVKNKKAKKEGFRLFVNNVSEDTSQDDLKAAFSVHGSVTDAYNPGKGFAFVNFATEDEANTAIEALNGKEVCGKEVECNIAKFKKKVQRGRARS